MDNNEHAKSCKIVFFGEPKVGKTNIITRFCDNRYDEESESTCGSEIYFKTVQIPGTKERVSFIIWDTALQRKYINISIYNYVDADVIVLTYREGDNSFHEIEQFWYDTVKQVMEKKPSIYKIYLL